LRWTWNPRKAVANRAKHRVSFETAVLVFEDPLHASTPDPHPDGDRWRTVGVVGGVVLFVVHTFPGTDDGDGQATGQIISARKATARERKAYEENIP
jgi:uncharacterized protein